MENETGQTAIAMPGQLSAPVIELEDDPRCEDRKHGLLVIDGELFAIGVQMSFRKDTGYSYDAFVDRLTAAVKDAFRPEMLARVDDYDQLPPFRDPLPEDASQDQRNAPSPRTLNIVAWVE